MSALYSSISSDSARTEATRRGHRRITAHTRGWTVGVTVEGSLDGAGHETFEVYVTSGSNGGPADSLIGRVSLHNGHRYFFPAPTPDERAAAIQALHLEGVMRDD